MKLWSKEALVLGGIYGVLDTPFSLLGFELISEILFGAFVIGALMLLFNKTPKLISFVINQYPQTAYYLAAIGWVPYFMIIIGFAIMGSYQILGYSDAVLGYLLFGLAVLALPSVIISLIAAYIKAQKKTT